MSNLTQEQPQRTEAIDLMEYAILLWWNKFIILLVAAICALGSYLITELSYTPLYTSTTKVYILEQDRNNTNATSGLSLGMMIASDCIEMIRCRPVIENAIDSLGEDYANYTYEYVRSCISVNNPDDTRFLQISATTPNPKVSQDLANAVRESASQYICDIMAIQAVNLVEEASLPIASSTSGAPRNAVFGFVVGGLVAAAVICIRYRLDDTIKTPEDVNRYLNLSVLGALPVMESSPGEQKKKKKKRRHSHQLV